jgi:hypothetical protein
VVCIGRTHTCPTKRIDKSRGAGQFPALHGYGSVAQKQCLRRQPSQVNQWSGRRPSRPWSGREALRDRSNTRSSRSSAPASTSIPASYGDIACQLYPLTDTMQIPQASALTRPLSAFHCTSQRRALAANKNAVCSPRTAPQSEKGRSQSFNTLDATTAPETQHLPST